MQNDPKNVISVQMDEADFRLDSDTGVLTSATYICTTNHGKRPSGTKIDTIVIHAISLPKGHYSGNYIEQFFTNILITEGEGVHPDFAELKGLKVSAHFLIKRGGELLQFVPTHRRAWHAGESSYLDDKDVNGRSIGIELQGWHGDKFESPQYDVLSNLVRFLMRTYPAIKLENIVAHSDIALPPGRREDPGPHFDWDHLWDSLRDPLIG